MVLAEETDQLCTQRPRGVPEVFVWLLTFLDNLYKCVRTEHDKLYAIRYIYIQRTTNDVDDVNAG
jgi:hypothetical protein